MEIGVDVLCVQLSVVGLENVARYRGKTCFYSDPDRKRILPRGSPQQVAQHIRDIIGVLKGPDGGLIGSVYITESEPLENVEAACEAFMEYGVY